MEEQTALDTQATEATDTSTETPQSASETPIQEPQEQYKPFSSGKEKFKVNGQDEEWDWEQTKKYAQLGKSSYKRLEEASKIQKQARDTYQKMAHAAQTDPEGLIRMFNPAFNPAAFQWGAKQGQNPGNGNTPEQQNPNQYDTERDQKLAALEEKFEAQEIENERKAVEKELDDAIKDYPQLKSKFLRSYVKSQYSQALRDGLYDISLADVAFHVSQEVESERSAEQKMRREKIEENKRKAPVSSVPGSVGQKPMTRDEVRKLAGRPPL